MLLNPVNIVIVDDNKEFTSILNEYLTESGIKVVGIANDGLEAISLIMKKKPDIVILDIMMPKLDGIDVLRRLNSKHMEKRPRFIILTAVGNDAITQAALTLGADLYMIKPFDMDMLIMEIKKFQTAILLGIPS